jgi:DNA polymerase III alpha subunit (gram-positive type)
MVSVSDNLEGHRGTYHNCNQVIQNCYNCKMLDDDQLYVIVDIEANGPTPGLFSMLSIGAVATTKEAEVADFYRKIHPLKGAGQHPNTMAWWKTQPEAWAEVTAEAEAPEKVMNDFSEWLEKLGKKPVFVAHPIAFDYTFVSWYLYKFVGRNLFTDNKDDPKTLDLKSYISAKYSKTIDASAVSKLPKVLL